MSLDGTVEAAELGPEQLATIERCELRLREHEASENPHELEEGIRLAKELTASAAERNAAEHPRALWLLSRAIAARHAQTHHWRDLEESIRLARLALQSTHLQADFRSAIHCGLTGLLRRRYGATKDVQDLRQAVDASERSVLLLPGSHPDRGARLNGHLLLVKELLSELFDISEVDGTINKIRKFFAAPVGRLDFWTRTNRRVVTDCLSRSYELSGHPKHMFALTAHAIEWWDGSSDPEAAPVGEQTWEESRMLARLVDKVSNLAAASPSDTIAMQISSAFHREYLTRVSKLGPRRSLAEIEREVKINVEIAMVIPRDEKEANEVIHKQSTERLEFAKSIGASTCQFRFKLPWVFISRSNKQNKLDSETSHAPGGTGLTQKEIGGAFNAPPKDEGSPTIDNEVDKRIEGLGAEFYEDRRAKVIGLLTEAQALWDARFQDPSAHGLDTAVKLARQAIALFASEGFAAVNLLLESDIPSGRSISEVRTDHELYSQAGLLLAVFLKALYQQDGQAQHLDEALDEIEKVYQMAVSFPYGDFQDMYLVVSRLGLLLRLRYLASRNLADLDLAIERMASVLKTYKSASEDRYILELYMNYALILSDRFRRTKRITDLTECISRYKSALSLMPADSPFYISALTSLSQASKDKFAISNDVNDLEDSWNYAKQVAAVVQSKPSTDFVLLNDLGDMLRDLALEKKRRGAFLNNSIFIEELSFALACIERAEQYVPKSHLARGSVLLSLGAVLQTKYTYEPSEQLLHRCIQVYQQAWLAPYQDELQRGIAGQRAGQMLCQADRWTEAASTLADVNKLLVRIASRWLPSADRLHVLSQLNGVAADAAMAQIQAEGKSPTSERVYQALRYLETGRGVVLGSALDYRGASTALLSAPADLAERFSRLSTELDTSARTRTQQSLEQQRRKLNERLEVLMVSIRQVLRNKTLKPPLPPGSMDAYTLQQRTPGLLSAYINVQREIAALPQARHTTDVQKRIRDLSDQFENLVEEIRTNEGLADFLQPPSLESAISLAGEGSIVVLASSSMAEMSAAFIINKCGLSVLPLPRLHPIDVKYHVQSLQRATRTCTLKKSAENNRELVWVLQWLWNAAVHPILEKLKETHDFHCGKPRVHWIGTGLLSGLPFHAAGEYLDVEDTGNSAMDMVVSSYTPTLRALAFTRDGAGGRLKLDGHERLLLVSAPSVPGKGRLPSVAGELDTIEAIVRKATVSPETVRLNTATPKQVISELPLANMVHFACHGHSDAEEIENSHLVLYADDVDEIEKKGDGIGLLSVHQIQALKAPTARIAYLSACSGAESKGESLADEVIHLTSAFQRAGFEHVIGALWQTKDVACRQVAENFYGNMYGVGEGIPVGDAAEVHVALHNAVQKLREANPRKPLIWAPFVHYGS